MFLGLPLGLNRTVKAITVPRHAVRTKTTGRRLFLLFLSGIGRRRNREELIVFEIAPEAVYRHFLTECFRAGTAASDTIVAAGFLGISGQPVAI